MSKTNIRTGILSKGIRASVSVYLISLLLLTLFSGLLANTTFAFDYPKLQNRSLLIGDTNPGATTSYTMSFAYPSSTTIGSIRFLICADQFVLDPCSSTPDADFSGGNLTSQSGVTGFGILSQSANEIIITRPSAGASTVQSAYEFDNIVNPSSEYGAIYVQIFTYSSSDGTGTPNHISSVASAISEPISINTKVPPILFFCVGLTVNEWCRGTSGNFIDYGSLDPVNGHWATTQFGAATNAQGGYVVTVNGNTMTSGNKKIEALEIPTVFQTGVPQFGMNLRANTSPAVGEDISGIGIGVATADYSYPDQFKYADGDTVAVSATGTMFNTFTATYIVNLPENQPSGVYNTTLTYICTASF